MKYIIAKINISRNKECYQISSGISKHSPFWDLGWILFKNQIMMHVFSDKIMAIYFGNGSYQKMLLISFPCRGGFGIICNAFRALPIMSQYNPNC